MDRMKTHIIKKRENGIDECVFRTHENGCHLQSDGKQNVCPVYKADMSFHRPLFCQLEKEGEITVRFK